MEVSIIVPVIAASIILGLLVDLVFRKVRGTRKPRRACPQQLTIVLTSPNNIEVTSNMDTSTMLMVLHLARAAVEAMPVPDGSRKN